MGWNNFFSCLQIVVFKQKMSNLHDYTLKTNETNTEKSLIVSVILIRAMIKLTMIVVVYVNFQISSLLVRNLIKPM